LTVSGPCFTGTQEQCSKALEHLEKIIRHKAAMLKAVDPNRTEPRSVMKMTYC